MIRLIVPFQQYSTLDTLAIKKVLLEYVLLEIDCKRSLYYKHYSCNNENKCVGFPLYSKCRRSGDCPFGSYCNFGHCVPTVNIGSDCNAHEACGRDGLCVYGDSNSAFGKCVEIMTLDSDTSNLLLAKMSSQFSNIY